MTGVPELLTVPEAAAQLRVGLTTIRELIRRRDIPSVSIGRRCLVRADAITAYIERQTRGGSA
ncbi:MAG TPA: helix-turn-helix domain-containing protein [Candidatus Saccharimonadales bacterium]|nr:helix-turn-helix domain-containing protein [Candidatus Saccharimonadales bacterium]